MGGKKYGTTSRNIWHMGKPNCMVVFCPASFLIRNVERNAVFEAVSPRRGASTFFAVRLSNHRLIETVNIRHTLNEYLRQYSGHIGYGVRPCERGKGYAGQILRLSLKFACCTV